MEDEIWKDVIGYEGLYKISSYGRVVSTERLDRLGRPVPEKELKAEAGHIGHMRVALSKNSKKRFLVHRLVAIMFIPNPEQYPFVLHNDDNPSNNNINNLRWGTSKHNGEDMVARGRQCSGDKNGMYGKSGHLSPKAIAVVDTKTKKSFPSIKDAAKSIGMDIGYLSAKLLGTRPNNTNFVYQKDYK